MMPGPGALAEKKTDAINNENNCFIEVFADMGLQNAAASLHLLLSLFSSLISPGSLAFQPFLLTSRKAVIQRRVRLLA